MQFASAYFVQHSSPEILACFLTNPFWGHFVSPNPSFVFNFLSKIDHRVMMNHLRFLQEEEVV